ncbi:MAG: cell division protein ZipA C-terminal FtsZ-binding domain-containing protein [Gammaproteobacteria bacterium]|jgi:cell division protein ZipA|nr:cell division protein ZipA C-terminal FtsZ-binding domain-containing protein [Gammaproteobacteria bacterium]
MTELRWVLLVIALLVLAALFVWTRYRPKIVDGLRVVERIRPPAAPAVERQEPVLPDRPPPPNPDKIVTIRVLSRAGEPFRGDELILALREAGLRHGRFGIFHSPVSDTDETAVFSVASLTEPGSFDLTRLQSDVYQGVSLFLCLPGPVEGVKAFDSMVTAARRVAGILSGNLVDEHGSTLSVQRERYLREEIIQFQHHQGRPA